MSEVLPWLSETPPTAEDHLAFALERQRERLLCEVEVVIPRLTNAQLRQVIQMVEITSPEETSDNMQQHNQVAKGF